LIEIARGTSDEDSSIMKILNHKPLYFHYVAKKASTKIG